MANTPVFGNVGEPVINAEAGIIDFPVEGWDYTDAKCRVIDEQLMPAMRSHARGGTYTVLRTKQAEGSIRLYWEPHNADAPMPSLKKFKLHAEAFMGLYRKPHYRSKMRKALPGIEVALATTRASVEEVVRSQHFIHSTGEKFHHDAS